MTPLYTNPILIFSLLRKISKKSLNLVNKWCINNNMSLHKCMLLGSTFKTKRARNLELAINDTILENVSSQNILGICVYSNLTWSRIYKSVTWYTQVHNLINKLNSKIVPTMDYGNTVWGQNCKWDTEKYTSYKRWHFEFF
jgi:hypothetical protein